MDARRKRARDSVLKDRPKKIFRGANNRSAVAMPEGFGDNLRAKNVRGFVSSAVNTLNPDMKSKYMNSIPSSLFRKGANVNFNKMPTRQTEHSWETVENQELAPASVYQANPKLRRITESALARVNYMPMAKKWLENQSKLSAQPIIQQGQYWKTSDSAQGAPFDAYNDGGEDERRNNLGLYSAAKVGFRKNKGLSILRQVANAAPTTTGFVQPQNVPGPGESLVSAAEKATGFTRKQASDVGQFVVDSANKLLDLNLGEPVPKTMLSTMFLASIPEDSSDGVKQEALEYVKNTFGEHVDYPAAMEIRTRMQADPDLKALVEGNTIAGRIAPGSASKWVQDNMPDNFKNWSKTLLEEQESRDLLRGMAFERRRLVPSKTFMEWAKAYWESEAAGTPPPVRPEEFSDMPQPAETPTPEAAPVPTLLHTPEMLAPSPTAMTSTELAIDNSGVSMTNGAQPPGTNIARDVMNYLTARGKDHLLGLINSAAYNRAFGTASEIPAAREELLKIAGTQPADDYDSPIAAAAQKGALYIDAAAQPQIEPAMLVTNNTPVPLWSADQQAMIYTNKSRYNSTPVVKTNTSMQVNNMSTSLNMSAANKPQGVPPLPKLTDPSDIARDASVRTHDNFVDKATINPDKQAIKHTIILDNGRPQRMAATAERKKDELLGVIQKQYPQVPTDLRAWGAGQSGHHKNEMSRSLVESMRAARGGNHQPEDAAMAQAIASVLKAQTNNQFEQSFGGRADTRRLFFSLVELGFNRTDAERYVESFNDRTLTYWNEKGEPYRVPTITSEASTVAYMLYIQAVINGYNPAAIGDALEAAGRNLRAKEIA